MGTGSAVSCSDESGVISQDQIDNGLQQTSRPTTICSAGVYPGIKFSMEMRHIVHTPQRLVWRRQTLYLFHEKSGGVRLPRGVQRQDDQPPP